MKTVLPRVLVVLLTAACGSEPPAARNEPVRGSSSATEASGDTAWFTDQTGGSGLDFLHFNGMSGEFYYPEVMPPGVALFDFDNDGDLDIFAPQGAMLGSKSVNDALFVPRTTLKGRLYRNDLTKGSDGTPTLRFVDVTDTSGLEQRGYGMGTATGDYNNDGCVDLYVTALGESQLFRNNCDGSFTDVTQVSRTASPGWSIPAAFVDFDRDGWLDLFVGHYVRYSLDTNIKCTSVVSLPDYCPPQVYRAEPSQLLRNNRDGTFSDVTAAAGMASEFGPALGVATADFNNDGWIDIHVSNDSTPNQLWMNQRNGTFKNVALIAGTAVSTAGLAKASMGVDAGDFDNDGDEDLFIAELTGQGADLYVNDGGGTFTDESARSGLRVATLPMTGFGAGWLDADNDGWLDLAMVNGLVTHTVEALARGEKFSLQQHKQLFRNLGNGRFEDVSARAGTVFDVLDVSRGLALGDIDNDGDTDMLVANDSGPLRLLVNQIGNRQHWVGLRLVGPAPSTSMARESAAPAAAPSNPSLPGLPARARQRMPRDMLGARALVARADGRMLLRRVRTDGSYASASDPRIVIGLGAAGDSVRVRVTWPDGTVEEWPAIPADRYSTLQQGTGSSIATRR